MHPDDIGYWISRSTQMLLGVGAAALGLQFLSGIRLSRGSLARLLRTEAILRALPLVGFMFSISPAAAARSRSAAPPSRSLLAPAPPWTRLGGSPPPLPLSRVQGPLKSKVNDGPGIAEQPDPAHGRTQRAHGRTHPAVHGSAKSDALESVLTGTQSFANGPGGPRLPRRLFPRAGSLHFPTGSPALIYPRSAGGGHEPKDHDAGDHRCNCYVVMPGDNLWNIAARRLKTGDPARIAGLSLQIYRHNRDVIGPDPDLVRPGRVLELPHE